MPATPPLLLRTTLVPGIVCLLLSAVGLLLIFGATPYEQVQALQSIRYHDNGGFQYLPLALTPTRYALLRGSLAAVALLSAGALLWLRATGTLQLVVRQLAQELRRLIGALFTTVHQLSRWQQVAGGGLLLVLLLVRIWCFREYPIATDEVAAYDYFVKPGPVAISSFYPIPNNHPLFHLLCWPLSLLTSNALLVLRLPTLLLATAGTSLMYVLLMQQVGFRAATLGLGLFGFSPLGLYYSVAGRGYFLQLLLIWAAFFAVAALWRGTYRQLGWSVFVAASILGSYTIPTFIYPLAALGTGLLLRLGYQRRWPDLGQLLLAGAAIALTTALLYAPIVAVSGLSQLLGNPYVTGLNQTAFWLRFPGYLYAMADMLAGQQNLGLRAGLAAAASTPLLWWRRPRQRPVLALLWLLLLLPVVLMLLQQVLPPVRVLLFMGYSGSVLAGIIVVALLTLLRVPARGQLPLILVLVAGHAVLHLQRQQPQLYADQAQDRQMRAAYRWLTARQARVLLVEAPQYALYFQHFALAAGYPLQLHAQPAPHTSYDFAVLPLANPPLAQPAGFRPLYQDDFVVIYGRAPTHRLRR
jgi:hypothetical protein